MSHSANSIPPADPLLGLPCGRIDATGGNSVCHRPWMVLFCFLTFYLLPTLPDGIVVDSGVIMSQVTGKRTMDLMGFHLNLSNYALPRIQNLFLYPRVAIG